MYRAKFAQCYHDLTETLGLVSPLLSQSCITTYCEPLHKLRVRIARDEDSRMPYPALADLDEEFFLVDDDQE